MEPETKNHTMEHSDPLPPRSTKHPSERGKVIRFFYLSLLVMFVGLTVGLILWGKQLTTPLSPPDYLESPFERSVKGS